MNEQTESEAALAAMNRAAAIARVRASRYGSRLAVWRDGSVVLLDPDTIDAGQGAGDQPNTAVESKLDGEVKTKPESEEHTQ